MVVYPIPIPGQHERRIGPQNYCLSNFPKSRLNRHSCSGKWTLICRGKQHCSRRTVVGWSMRGRGREWVIQGNALFSRCTIVISYHITSQKLRPHTEIMPFTFAFNYCTCILSIFFYLFFFPIKWKQVIFSDYFSFI